MGKILGIILVIIIVSFGACATPSAPPPVAPTDWSADGIISAEEYLDEAKYDDFEIYWVSDEQNIFVGMRAKTTGWVAVGFGSTEKMKGADVVFGFVLEGETFIYDLFCTGRYGPHPEDMELGGSYDILAFGGKEERGYTTIEFARALSTGDEYDNELMSGENPILWSYGKEGRDELPPSMSADKHASRGYGEIIISPAR